MVDDGGMPDRERADRQTAEPDATREGDGAFEDGIAGVGTFGCDHASKKARPFVCVNSERLRM